MVARYGTVLNHVGKQVLCEDYGDSVVVVGKDTNEELLVEEEGTPEYEELAKHDGHNIEIVEVKGAVQILCKDCNKVLAEVVEAYTELAEDREVEFSQL